MDNIYNQIAVMRQGMKAIGCSKEEIELATKEVTSQESYEDAVATIKKYWK